MGGIAQGPDNYIGSKTIPVECGVNRIMVRSTDKAGTISIKATAKSLKADAISVKTIATDLGALSTNLPGENLPSYLEKGPTPATPSFTKTRNTVAIIGAKTNSNQADAQKSFDDNELSEWTNGDGVARIEYELAREATINQVVLKLAGWRSKKYPIRILVDGKKVFEETTPTSLGYVTLDLTPVKGKKVTIELIGTSENSNAINLVEITGKVDEGGLKQTKSKMPQLPIVEVEFYEAL